MGYVLKVAIMFSFSTSVYGFKEPERIDKGLT
jgi:hypothetical protein